jgi:hypothetical protein
MGRRALNPVALLALWLACGTASIRALKAQGVYDDDSWVNYGISVGCLVLGPAVLTTLEFSRLLDWAEGKTRRMRNA